MRRLTPDRLSVANAPARLGAPAVVAPTAPAVDPAAAMRAQAERDFAAAREQGRATGLKDAEAEVARRVEVIAAKLRTEHESALAATRKEQVRLRASADGIEAAIARHADDAELLAVVVAYAAVVRLLGARVAERQHVVDLCRAVLHDYGSPQATLHLSESDIALLPDGAPGVAVEGDRRLAPGQCVIVTARGQFESGLDVRLERLKRALLDAVAGQGTP
jgi:flagellar biosynthesis/type III secretory pathway protein FliH